jgi:hypothetical protein
MNEVSYRDLKCPDDSDSDDEEENDYVQDLRLEGSERSGMI